MSRTCRPLMRRPGWARPLAAAAAALILVSPGLGAHADGRALAEPASALGVFTPARPRQHYLDFRAAVPPAPAAWQRSDGLRLSRAREGVAADGAQKPLEQEIQETGQRLEALEADQASLESRLHDAQVSLEAVERQLLQLRLFESGEPGDAAPEH